jgi:sulfatase maturation enzyme AslB (radical SAM superfamily)
LAGPGQGAAASPWDGERLTPKRVVVETVFGCNARCSFCIIDQPTSRRKGIMPMDLFARIVDSLQPYKDDIEMFDLFGLGEPLVDPQLFERIRCVRSKGFSGLAISTNAHLLSPQRQKALLESGIDTVLFSIDGIRKETHEALRRRIDFDRVVRNCIETIERRDAGGYRTRFVIRFIRQPANRHEWGAFREFWNPILSKEKGDLLAYYDVHDWSGQAVNEEDVEGSKRNIYASKRWPCHHLFEKLVILANGEVALCFEDILDARFGFGNVMEQDPVDLFNCSKFNEIRRLHLQGRRCEVDLCAGCSVLEHEQTRGFG